MTTSTQTLSKPKRRWLRFSLRTLLVVSVLIGFGCAWVGMQLQQKRRHEAVVKEIERLGGYLIIWDADSSYSSWKIELFGIHVVKSISINLDNSDATDSLLSQFQGMNCYGVSLSSTRITDAGIVHLKSMTSLEQLTLRNTKITDAGLVHLTALKGLLELDLDSTSVTQEGVDRLQKAIPKCEIVYSPIETSSKSASK